jgi:hypothetical protein
MAIPYQPNYKLQPKTGFRYSAQPFVPPQQPINAPPPLGLDGSAAAPPPVMGGQQGPAYANDPFDGDSNQFQPNYKPAAESLGYTQGVQNPAGVVRAIPLVGNFMADSLSMGQDSKYTFGNPGTYDQAGNVFGTEGRAYNPVTGQAAQSYSAFSGPNSWLGNTYGIGTEEGFGGPNSSYGKLRAAGENIPSSLLGSYEKSIYRQQELNPNLNTAQARAAQLRGTADRGAGVRTMQGVIEDNTAMYNPAFAASQGYSDDDIDRIDGTEISREMLGFTDARPDPGKISGRFGTQQGDLARTQSGIGVINESGQIETPTGTTVSITDPYTGKSISLLGSTLNSTDGKSTLSAKNELARNQTLDARANPEGSGMSGFNVDDGKGGSYQTSSTGVSKGMGADAGKTVYGMEDEYDDEPSGGK